MVAHLALLLSAAAVPVSEVDLDAIVAAPGNHKVLLENERVRILQVEVGPGETEAVHEHRWPSVLFIQAAQPAIDIDYVWRDGRLVESGRHRLPPGKPPPAIWVPKQGAHAVQNLGKSPFRLLRIERKESASGNH